jgi:hypothetical protein
MPSQLFAKKPLAVLLEELHGENRLRRILGPVTLTSLGVGAIIGTGIFVLTGGAAHDKTGPALVLSFVVSGTACVFAALCYRQVGTLRRILLLLLLGLCAGASAATPAASPGDTLVVLTPGGAPLPWAAALRRELLARLEADQAARLALQKKQQHGQSADSFDAERFAAVDTANTRWLKGVVAAHGWPGRSLVGADGADAAFILVQHADRDTAFQAQVLPLLERAVAMGEAEGQQLALLTDRLAIARGSPQVYGTQAAIVDGRVILKPIADSTRVDERRARVGLPPLAEYLAILDSLYAPQRPRTR